jgi:hypothetical protein
VKRAILAAAACGAVLAIGSPSASAAVGEHVYKCEGSATWQVTVTLSQSYATRTLSGPIKACKQVHAVVEDDGNFAIYSEDTDPGSVSSTPNLVGGGVTGVPAFVGVVTSPSGRLRGPIVIAGPDSLTATIANADAPPGTAVEEHLPDGSCGTNCWRTKAIWIGTYGS